MVSFLGVEIVMSKTEYEPVKIIMKEQEEECHEINAFDL
jgi:hypothetical protein